MAVPTLITELSTTASSNAPAGSDSPSTLDDIQRAHASFIAELRDDKTDAADLAASSGASLVGYLPAGTGAVATDVQGKLREIEISDSDYPTIQEAVDALQSGQRLVISSVHTTNLPITITNKSRVRITGKGNVSLSGAASGAFLFQLVGVVDDLEIDSLTLAGDNNAAYSQCAIGCNSGQTISNTKFHDLTISNINVGISHNADLSGSWTNAWTYNNNLKNILGVGAGQGYGIHMANAKNCHVYGNTIDTASRHAIYQARGTDCNNVIKNNIILNHRVGVATGSYLTAIHVLRSSGVSVLNNRVHNFYDGGLLIGHDTSTSSNCENILVSGNTFTNRLNVVPSIAIGEQVIPTSYKTSKVDVIGNTFSEDETIGGVSVKIFNGTQLTVTGNTFRRYSVSGTPGHSVELASSSYATSDSHVADVTITGNTATCDNAVTAGYFAYISTQLCTGSSSYTIKDNNLVGYLNVFNFQTTPTNLNSRLKFKNSQTIDFASVAANGYVSAAYTVTGTKPTSVVTMRPQYTTSLPLGFQVFAHNTSVNGVGVFLQNPTVAPVDWPSQTVIFSVEDF